MRSLDPDRLSPAAQRVIQRAWALARIRGLEHVPLDSLVDAVRQEEGVAREILERYSLHEQYPADFDHLPSLPPKRLLDADVAAVLSAAEAWVRDVGRHLTVGSEHLLFGILNVDQTFRDNCAAAGLTVEELHSTISEASGFSSEPLDANVELSEFSVSADEGPTALRIIDASFNRAGEGLRVVEDYFRFGLDDAALSAECKAIRHALQEPMRRLSIDDRAAVRDVAGDVGTSITLPTEQARGSASEVAAANLSRVCESLRSAEEYAKTLDGEVARTLEQLRYRTYMLEKVFSRTVAAIRRLDSASLYLLVGVRDLPMPLDTIIAAALAGGVDVIQLRDKTVCDREYLDAASRVRAMTRAAHALFIVNDRPDLAVLADADGVHLGQDDVNVSEARRIVGSRRLIGVSTHNPKQAASACREGADYLGVGPTFPSQTKSFSDFPGLKFVQQVAATHRLPAFAIGGITQANVPDVVDAGLDRVAVSRAITHAEQPEFAAKQLKSALSQPARDLMS